MAFAGCPVVPPVIGPLTEGRARDRGGGGGRERRCRSRRRTPARSASRRTTARPRGLRLPRACDAGGGAAVVGLDAAEPVLPGMQARSSATEAAEAVTATRAVLAERRARRAVGVEVEVLMPGTTHGGLRRFCPRSLRP